MTVDSINEGLLCAKHGALNLALYTHILSLNPMSRVYY